MVGARGGGNVAPKATEPRSPKKEKATKKMNNVNESFKNRLMHLV
jgi:hypothetical protein